MLRPGFAEAPVRIHPRETSHAVGQAACGVDNEIPAHRMADEDHGTEPKLLCYGDDVRAKSWHRPGPPAGTRLPMARQIERHDVKSIGEVIPLVLPVPSVARPTVDEHQARRPSSPYL